MNRSFRNLAVLGLLALGASSAGAQTNILFNVTYDPTSLRLTFTPTGNAVTWSGGSSGSTINSTLGAGIYFENFFTGTPPYGSALDLQSVYLSGGLQGTSSSGSNTLNGGFSDTLYALNIARGSETTQALTFNYGVNGFTAQPLVIEFASSVEAYMKTQSSFPNFTGGQVTIFEDNTYVLGTYTYSAVPEPSTYAAIAGALGLGYAVYRRRRQAAAVTAAA
jgi:hypothetical protein